MGCCDVIYSVFLKYELVLPLTTDLQLHSSRLFLFPQNSFLNTICVVHIPSQMMFIHAHPLHFGACPLSFFVMRTPRQLENALTHFTNLDRAMVTQFFSRRLRSNSPPGSCIGPFTKMASPPLSLTFPPEKPVDQQATLASGKLRDFLAWGRMVIHIM